MIGLELVSLEKGVRIRWARAEVGNPRLRSRMWLFCLPSAALLLFFEASECEMILRSMTLTTGEDLFFFFWKTLMTYAP